MDFVWFIDYRNKIHVGGNEMKQEIKIGIIGTGVGVRTLIPGFKTVKGTNIAAICGSSKERADEFAKRLGIPEAFGDYKELCELPDLDLICVASPNIYHYEQAICVMKRNKHLLCEKPLTMTMKETESLVQESHKTPNICAIDHQLRFNPYFQKIRSILIDNGIGKPYFVRIHQQSTGFSDRNTPWNWSFDEKLGGGVRLAMASHLTDLLWFWFGKKCLNVRGAMDSVVRHRKDLTGKDTEVRASNFFSAGLALDGGIDVQLSATAASCGIGRFDVSIYGDEGELYFDLENKLKGAFLKKRCTVQNIDVQGVMKEEIENKISFFSGTFQYFAPLLSKAIMTNDFSYIDTAAKFDDAIPTQQVLDAIRDSTMNGNVIKLAEGYKPGANV